MANKKPTVLNDLGYQENLKDTDSLALGTGPDIILNSDGTSSFTDTLTVGDTTSYVELYDNGSLQCRQGQQSAWLFEDANKALSIYSNVTGAILTSYIKRDGSATFTSDVTVGTPTNGTIVSPTSVQVIQSGNANIALNADGSASFAGTISIGGMDVDAIILDGADAKYLLDLRYSGTNIGGLYRDASGNLKLYLKDGNGDVKIELDGETGIGDFSSYIQTEGDDSYFTANRTGTHSSSAALYLGFKGGVQKFKVGLDGYVETDSYLQVNSSGMTGTFNTYLNSSIGNEYFIASKAPGTLANSPIIWGVESDGSAYFSGSIIAGADGANSSTEYFRWQPSGGITVNNPTATAAVFQVYDGVSADFRAKIFADGSANFDSGVVVGNANSTFINLEASGTLSLVNNSNNTNVIQYSRPSQSPRFAVTVDGDVNVGGGYTSSDGYGATMYEGGYLARNDSSSQTSIFTGYKGGTAAANETISIWNDGSALYRGDIVTQADSAVNAYCKMYSAGYFTIANQTGFGQVFGIYNTTSGATTARINIDGSAEFASGSTTISGSSGLQVFSSSGASAAINGDGIYQKTTSGSVASMLLADGSATFASTVLTGDAGNYTSGDGGTALFTGDTYFAGGNVTVYKNTDAYSKDAVVNNAWECWTRDDGTSNTMTLRSSIHADGSAYFAGDATFGNAVSSGSTSGIFVQNTGGTAGAAGLHIYQNGVSGEPFIKGYSNSTDGGTKTPKFHINTDGSAVFDGVVTAGGSANNGVADGIELYPNGQVVVSRTGESNSIFTGFTTGSNNTTVDITADGNAFFSGKVTSYGDPSAGAATGSSMHGGSGFSSAADGDGFPLYRAYKTGVSDALFIATSDGTVIAGNQLQYNTDVSGNYQIKINSSGISANFYGGTDTNVIFSSNLLAGSFDLSSDVSGSYMTTQGDLTLQKDSSNASNKAFKTYNGTSETSSITGTGEAEFAKVTSPHFALESLPVLPVP